MKPHKILTLLSLSLALVVPLIAQKQVQVDSSAVTPNLKTDILVPAGKKITQGRSDLSTGTVLTIGNHYYASWSANKALTLDGATSLEGGATSVKATVSAVITLGFPSAKRGGETNTPIGSLVVYPGVHMFTFVRIGGELCLYDTVGILNNLTATTDPATSNDSAQAYSKTSLWINTTTNAVFICTDSTGSAAVWRKINNPLKADEVEAPYFAADAGANDTYTATLSPAITAYVTGARYRFKANTANTGAATINFNAIGAKTIKKAAGGITTDLSDNDIRAGQWVDLVYDGTNMQMQSASGNSPSATDTAAIHGNVSAEISLLTNKAAPVGADLSMIEDSASANAKKRAQLDSYPLTTATTAAINLSRTVNATADALSDDAYTGAVLMTGKNAGATVAQWDLVYLNSSGQWVLCDADGSGTFGQLMGLAITSGTNGNPLTVLLEGFVRNDGWTWTASNKLYMSTTAGGMTATAPSTATNAIVLLGFAITDDEIYFKPSQEWSIKG